MNTALIDKVRCIIALVRPNRYVVIAGRGMGVVPSLLCDKVNGTVTTRAAVVVPVVSLGLKTLHGSQDLEQGAIHRKMLVADRPFLPCLVKDMPGKFKYHLILRKERLLGTLSSSDMQLNIDLCLSSIPLMTTSY